MGSINERRLFEVLRPHLKFLGPDQPLEMDSDLPKLGLDSMSAINLLLDLEQSFDVVFPDELLVAETFRTPAALATAIDEIKAREPVR